jgi:phosphotransferase system enzyme I (PtsP)
MVREAFPSEDDQYRVYRNVLEAFAPRPVTIRTLDVGGDKGLPYFPMEETNPFLGWRGIRLTLDNPGIFLTQLRALLRANAGVGNLQILLPMISSTWEVDAVRELLARSAAESGVASGFDDTVKLGAMVEVPSALYQMDALAKRVDFFSIGTNDLTQYLLAVDRTNARVSSRFDSLHPAVIRAINEAVRAAHSSQRPISVCGEMAGDPASAVLLVGMGINALSMASASIPSVKRALRTFTQEQTQRLAAEAIAAEDPSAVHRLLRLAFADAGLSGDCP